MAFKLDDTFIVLGRKQIGKSHLARRVQACFPRKVIFNTLRDSYRGPEFRRVETFAGFAHHLAEVHELREFQIVFDFFRYDLGDPRKEHWKELNACLRALFERGEAFDSPLLVVIEEAHNFCTPYQMPSWLTRCLREGAHAQLALLFTTQRPGGCHKDIIAAANHVFCGSLHDRSDLEYARAVLHERSASLPMLPVREFYYFRPGVGTVLIDNDFRELGKR